MAIPAGEGVRLADVEAAMKEVYVGRSIEDLTGNTGSTYRRIKNGTKSAVELNSRGASIVGRVRNNVSERLSNAEFADFPSAGRSQLYKFNITAKGFQATCLFSHQAMSERRMTSAIINEVQGQIDNKLENTMNSLNFYAWGDGSGERARVGSVSYAGTVATVVCDNPGNLYGTQNLEEGMQVEFRTSAGTLRSTGAAYATIDTTDNGTMTFVTESGAPTNIAAGDRIYIRDSYNGAPAGVLYHINNSGPWQGLTDRTLYKNTSCPVINAAGDAISPVLVDKMESAQAFKRGDSYKVKGEFYASSQFYGYKQLGYELRVQMDAQKFDGGIQTITHGGNKINWERDVPRDAFCQVDFDELRRFDMQELDFVKNVAGGYFHQINASSGQLHASGKAVYFEGFFNWGCVNPNKLGSRIYGLSTTGLDLGNNT